MFMTDEQLQQVEDFADAVEQRALDLSLNDCQMWSNLPRSMQKHYLREAANELADE